MKTNKCSSTNPLAADHLTMVFGSLKPVNKISGKNKSASHDYLDANKFHKDSSRLSGGNASKLTHQLHLQFLLECHTLHHLRLQGPSHQTEEPDWTELSDCQPVSDCLSDTWMKWKYPENEMSCWDQSHTHRSPHEYKKCTKTIHWQYGLFVVCNFWTDLQAATLDFRNVIPNLWTNLIPSFLSTVFGDDSNPMLDTILKTWGAARTKRHKEFSQCLLCSKVFCTASKAKVAVTGRTVTPTAVNQVFSLPMLEQQTQCCENSWHGAYSHHRFLCNKTQEPKLTDVNYSLMSHQIEAFLLAFQCNNWWQVHSLSALWM